MQSRGGIQHGFASSCRGECWNLTWTPVQINGQVARSLGMGRAGSSLGPQGPSCTQRKMRFSERRRPSKLKVPPKRMSIAGTWFLHTSISFCGLSILLNLVYTFSWGKNNWSLCNISFLSGRLYVGGSVGGKGVNDEGGCREKMTIVTLEPVTPFSWVRLGYGGLPASSQENDKVEMSEKSYG